ncbi:LEUCOANTHOCYANIDIN DIOXYGENASE-LIKE PROTEIN [Salix purpurea]|uniref:LEUCOANTHOCYANIDIN DIOXYGENASE-LIKE PROTEIN n=1 Tax=Salix purpurea TaxID=77065 RepID=A0A9Q0TUK3_SALPP|nr:LEUCOANTHOCYANIDIN DIOXYGENASE-LIKE PROTEIN [Salix purpurea]
MNKLQEWPEPIVRVQSLSDSGGPLIPERYVKPVLERPSVSFSAANDVDIPIIDLAGLYGDDHALRATILDQISIACREWGFFQVINHGVSPRLMDHAREVWREFFLSPMEVKQAYANTPKTYEGYGSRLGVEKGQFSMNTASNWWSCVGGACMRVNFYPKCPQPGLTLGLSSHSDPGGMTLLLPDSHVPGLQVRRDENWITVKPVPHAFIVNIGDQIQVTYTSLFRSPHYLSI